jgi:hypothetical protein
VGPEQNKTALGKSVESNADNIHKYHCYKIHWTEKGMSKTTFDYKLPEFIPKHLFLVSSSAIMQAIKAGKIPQTE